MRIRCSTWLCAGTAMLTLGFLAGCDTETAKAPPTKGTSPKEEKHEEEGHMHGPNGGEVVELEGEGDHFHLEWERNVDSGLVTFYLLDKDLNNVAETDATEITIETKVGDKESKYTLPRSASESETAKTTKFELTDKALVTSLSAPEGVKNTVKISIGGKPYSGDVKHDPDHDHH